jgi:hypothetical protein
VLAWLAWLFTLPPRPAAWVVVSSALPLFLLASWLMHRPEEERWGRFARRTLDLHALGLVLLLALGVQFEDAHGVTTDGVIYFTQLRSVLFDRDLNVAAEFAYLGQPPRPYHVVPIGPTIVWLPLYLGVAAADAVGRSLGAWPAPSEGVALGLTLPYIRAALTSSFVVGSVGLVVIHRRLRAEFESGIAFLTSLLVFGATPLVWYMVYEPSMTHAASFGFVALFIVLAERWTSVAMTRRHAILLGVTLGLAFITRPQEALFALFPAVLLMTAAAPLDTRVRAAARLAVWAFVGVVPFLALQAVHSTILMSRETFDLVGNDGYLDFVHSRWADTLWSSWHGFLSWTPLAYIALLGTAFYVRKHRPWAIAALLIVFLMAWINGSTADWAAGWSFGGRRFVSILAVLAPGLAYVVWQLARRPLIAVGIVVVLAIGWNQLLVAQYATGTLPKDAPVSFGQIVRQQAMLLTGPPFVYPFAFPANAWFAWRTGLPLDRYDLLGPESLRPSFDLPMNAAAGKFLISGWGPRASDAAGELRWIDGPQAELVLPLDIPADRDISLRIQARTRMLDPPEPAMLKISINGRVLGTVTPDPQQLSEAMFTVPAGTGILIRGFNRIAFEKDAAAPPVALYRVVIQ